MFALGIDTSNYTTSAALVNIDTLEVVRSVKKLLPVKSGECGLRQSDAVFHHTSRLPGVLEELFAGEHFEIGCVGVSEKPTSQEGSYMPCFLPGVSVASAVSQSLSVPVYRTTHQIGHIMCATVLKGAHHLLQDKFLAFHVSGGTTELVLCEPDVDTLLKTTVVARSLDLKAGQAIDRIGGKLGLDFPAGPKLEELARASTKNFSKSPVLKGCDCCLSGVENLAQAMIEHGECAEDVAKFTLDYIGTALENMLQSVTDRFGLLPTVYTGGVMSNKILQARFKSENTYFAGSEFSADNACGVALLAAISHKDRD